MIHSFFLFGTVGCLYEANLSSPAYHKRLETTEKLLRGFIFSLDRFCARLFNASAEDEGPVLSTEASFETMETDCYKLHYYDTLTGYKLVCFTDRQTPSLVGSLRDIYEKIFVPAVVLHPQFKPIRKTTDKTVLQQDLQRLRAVVACSSFPQDVSRFFNNAFH